MVLPSILKSHKHSKLKHILSFVFHNDLFQNHCWLSLKCMAPNCLVVVSVLLPIFCHNGSGMAYLCIFVVDVVQLVGAMTNKWV